MRGVFSKNNENIFTLEHFWSTVFLETLAGVISPQLLNGLSWNFVQTFMVPGGRSRLTLINYVNAGKGIHSSFCLFVSVNGPLTIPDHGDLLSKTGCVFNWQIVTWALSASFTLKHSHTLTQFFFCLFHGWHLRRLSGAWRQLVCDVELQEHQSGEEITCAQYDARWHEAERAGVDTVFIW